MKSTYYMGLESTVTRKFRRRLIGLIMVVLIPVVLGGCAWFHKGVDSLVSRMQGRSATITTYDTFGRKLDRVHGSAIDIHRDATFDSTNPDGSKNADSSVISVSVGGGVMTHVGSTLLMVQDGIVDVSGQLPLRRSTSPTPIVACRS